MKKLVVVLAILLSACTEKSQHADLQKFIDNVISKPRGVIEPIPEFTTYRFFRYQSTAKRSPFLLPKTYELEEVIEVVGTVEPNLLRNKQPLEAYPLNDIRMVGLLNRKNGALWVLLQTGDGLVHRVRSGNYIGKNHGRIIRITQDMTDLIEIVPNGFGGWMERPRSISMNGSNRPKYNG